jgi:hypothetical protein
MDLSDRKQVTHPSGLERKPQQEHNASKKSARCTCLSRKEQYAIVHAAQH